MLGSWEIPRIGEIRTLERRAFAELAVPGRAGSLFQDLNTTPTRIAVSGASTGTRRGTSSWGSCAASFATASP